MAAADPGKRARKIEITVIGVTGSGDGIADGGKTCNLNERRTDGKIERGRVLKAETRGRGVIHVLVEEESIAEERQSSKGDERWREGMGLGSDKILRAMVFTDGKSGDVGAGSRERVKNNTLAENIAEVQRISGSEVMIETRAELIVVR